MPPRRVELEVVFLSERVPTRPYPLYDDEFHFAWRVLHGRGLIVAGRWSVLNRGPWKPTFARRWRRRREPARVLADPRLAKAHRIPTLCWVESTARDDRRGRPPIEAAKRLFIRGCAGFVVPGSASAEYLASLGVAPGDMTVAPNAVDNEIFGARVASERGRRDALRQELGLASPTVLYVGRLEEEKGLDILIRAMESVDADLVVAGAGSRESALRAQAGPRTASSEDSSATSSSAGTRPRTSSRSRPHPNSGAWC